MYYTQLCVLDNSRIKWKGNFERATTNWDKNKKNKSSKVEKNFPYKGGNTEMLRLDDIRYRTPTENRGKRIRSEPQPATNLNNCRLWFLPRPTNQGTPNEIGKEISTWGQPAKIIRQIARSESVNSQPSPNHGNRKSSSSDCAWS